MCAIGVQAQPVPTAPSVTLSPPAPAPPELTTLSQPDPIALAPAVVYEPAAAPSTLPAPPAAPPAAVADPDLARPLAPLTTFDATPPVTAAGVPVPTDPAEAGTRYDLAVTGLEGTPILSAFNPLSTLRRDRGKPATGAQLGARAQSDAELLQTLLRSEGYYAAQVDSRIGPEQAANGRVRVTLAVTTGPRYKFDRVELTGVPADRPAIATDFGIKPGQYVIAERVELAEDLLKLRLPEEGYPFATFGERDVLLDDATRTGDYTLKIDAGRLARFGGVQMRGRRLPFGNRHAQVIARFKRGERYTGKLVEDLRRAMVATQLFGSVAIEPVASSEVNPDGSVDTNLVVRTLPGAPRTVAGSLGYSTSEGVRAEALLTHRNLLAPEGSLTGRAVVGTLEQRVAAQFRKANFGQRDRSLNVLAEVANERKPAYDARSLTFAANISRDSTPIWQKTWTYSAGIELIGSDIREKASKQRRAYLIGALPLQVGYDASNDLLNPERGFRILGRISPETSLRAGNNANYLRTLLEGSYYQPFGSAFVLAGRLRIGAIVGSKNSDIAPTRRFYAGGGGSVRGYGFQDIGPKDINNEPLGGKSLAEFSIEPRYRFGNYGVVAFFDGGNVYQTEYPTFKGLRYGYGIGARYYTSFGPLRLDLARGLNRRRGDPPVALYISIGQAF